MEVLPVDERHLDRRIPEPANRPQSTEAASDDNDTVTGLGRLAEGLRKTSVQTRALSCVVPTGQVDSSYFLRSAATKVRFGSK
jgi:hypothetical protein